MALTRNTRFRARRTDLSTTELCFLDGTFFIEVYASQTMALVGVEL